MMRHFLRESSLVGRLTSCMVNAPLTRLLIPLACLSERPLSSTLCACLAAIPVTTITRPAKDHQLMAARIGTAECAGAVVLHASLAEGTGQSLRDRRHCLTSSSTMTPKARGCFSGLHSFGCLANLSGPMPNSNLSLVYPLGYGGAHPSFLPDSRAFTLPSTFY